MKTQTLKAQKARRLLSLHKAGSPKEWELAHESGSFGGGTSTLYLLKETIPLLFYTGETGKLGVGLIFQKLPICGFSLGVAL